VHLRHAEAFCVFDDHEGCVWNVYADFDNCCRYKDIEVAALELLHDDFFFIGGQASVEEAQAVAGGMVTRPLAAAPPVLSPTSIPRTSRRSPLSTTKPLHLVEEDHSIAAEELPGVEHTIPEGRLGEDVEDLLAEGTRISAAEGEVGGTGRRSVFHLAFAFYIF